MRRKIIQISAAVLILIVSSSQVFAYSITSNGYYYSTIGIANQSSKYTSAVNNAINDWNNAGAGRRVLSSAAYCNIVYDGKLSDSMYGVYLVLEQGGSSKNLTTEFDIALNTVRIGSNQTIARSTAGHKLGTHMDWPTGLATVH